MSTPNMINPTARQARRAAGSRKMRKSERKALRWQKAKRAKVKG